MKSFFGTDRLKRSRILKAILFIIIMISAVSSMSLLYQECLCTGRKSAQVRCKKESPFYQLYSYAWETVPGTDCQV